MGIDRWEYPARGTGNLSREIKIFKSPDARLITGDFFGNCIKDCGMNFSDESVLREKPEEMR